MVPSICDKLESAMNEVGIENARVQCGDQTSQVSQKATCEDRVNDILAKLPAPARARGCHLPGQSNLKGYVYLQPGEPSPQRIDCGHEMLFRYTSDLYICHGALASRPFEIRT